MKPTRLDALDALRGFAVVWMTGFHFSFDLNHFGFLHQNFYVDPFWTWQRSAIVSLFLFCAGMGQAVAVVQGQDWPRFWRRWLQVAACAVLVSTGSWWMFPHSFIYFGVLHGVAVMLIIVRLTAHWGRWLWLLGSMAIATKFIAEAAITNWPGLDFLNARAWNWLGLISRKPITEDYVPLIPWLGVMWWGMAVGRWWLARSTSIGRRFKAHGPSTPLAWLGRWSLSWYMLHQPVLIGLLSAWVALQ